MEPRIGASFPVASRLSAMSRRKVVLQAAASSSVKGGDSRVLARPGSDAFAITAMPQEKAYRLADIVVRSSIPDCSY